MSEDSTEPTGNKSIGVRNGVVISVGSGLLFGAVSERVGKEWCG